MERFLITGATGFIGSMLIKHMISSQADAQVTAIVRDCRKAAEVLPSEVHSIQIDLRDRNAVLKIQEEFDYIIHCASVTQSAEMLQHPVEVTESIVNVTQNVLELAQRCKLKSMVYLSSMEVYGNVDCLDGKKITESEVSSGKVELLNPRSCYPLGKRMAENICYSYYKEYGVPVRIARLAQTFGRGILPGDNRIFAQFARAVKENRDIVLHTKGNSVGNYCGINDAVKGILMILKHGKDGEAYNVVNEKNTMKIRQMAELVAGKIADGKIKVVYDIPMDNRYGYAADTGLCLSGKKLMELGWQPEEGLEDMYREMM